MPDRNFPLVSCLVATMPSRRRFWPMMFKCFEHQDWPNKRMVLLDDEETAEKLPRNVEHVVVKSATIGRKLNVGVAQSVADFYHKWDDDDWYASNFLGSMVNPIRNVAGGVSVVLRHSIFLVRDWELYSMYPCMGGGSICFDKASWEEKKFEEVSLGEDQDFILGRTRFQTVLPQSDNYVLVRHGGNTWKRWSHGATVETEAKSRGVPIPGGPEGFFSAEDLKFYRSLRDQQR